MARDEGRGVSWDGDRRGAGGFRLGCETFIGTKLLTRVDESRVHAAAEIWREGGRKGHLNV